MKLWARYEQGFINHDKFRAITANAIALWLEGKNYADTKLTDGLLPDYEVKLWRFHGKKSVALLTRSCGLKPGTTQPYAPLWEPVDGFGFKMHDYLEHNDCREVVQERIDKADAARELRNSNQAAYRERRKAERDADVAEALPPALPEKAITESITRYQRSAEVIDKQKQIVDPKETREERAPVSRLHTPIIGRNPHLQHAACDETLSRCVPDVIHRKFADALAPKHGGDREAAKAELQGWYPSVWATLPAAFVMGEAFRFWQARFDAAFASPSSVGPSGDDAMWAAIAKKGPSVRP